MQEKSYKDNPHLNAYHNERNRTALKAVEEMLKHPLSQEEARAHFRRMRGKPVTKPPKNVSLETDEEAGNVGLN